MGGVLQRYRPTKGDLAFRDSGDLDPINLARVLRRVSDDYLSAMIADNQKPGSSGFRSQLEFELARRSAVRTKASLAMQAFAVAISVLALLVAVSTLT